MEGSCGGAAQSTLPPLLILDPRGDLGLDEAREGVARPDRRGRALIAGLRSRIKSSTLWHRWRRRLRSVLPDGAAAAATSQLGTTAEPQPAFWKCRAIHNRCRAVRIMRGRLHPLPTVLQAASIASHMKLHGAVAARGCSWRTRGRRCAHFARLTLALGIIHVVPCPTLRIDRDKSSHALVLSPRASHDAPIGLMQRAHALGTAHIEESVVDGSIW